MENYGAAFYQQDVIDKLKKRHEVFLYGPGYSYYNRNDTIVDVISISSFDKPDLICIGHSWLSDHPNKELNCHHKIRLRKLSIAKVMILNKEYSRLDEKLNYIKSEGIDLVFTHHHSVEKYEKSTGVKFIFWPFAVNHERFKDYGFEKEYDLIFTGLLRNPTWPNTQSDIRIKVQNKLFYTLGELRLIRRYRYREYKIFWRGQPASRKVAKLNRFLHRESRLPPSEYSKLLNKGKICFNALSPLELVGTRYYEAMASKCLVFCQRSSLYKGLFKEGKHFVTFSEDLSDFDGKLSYYLENKSIRQEIENSAYKHVLKCHTWKKRILQFEEAVKAYINP